MSTIGPGSTTRGGTVKPQDQDLDEPDDLPDQDPAKMTRCYNFADGHDIPRTYFENTSKEELVNEHVLEYKNQFEIMYDAQRPLLLIPLNERGVKKFICTTIRPTKLPFTELYEWDKCAKFISDYLEYEELPNPLRFPD